jgi:hypothetical protein
MNGKMRKTIAISMIATRMVLLLVLTALDPRFLVKKLIVSNAPLDA